MIRTLLRGLCRLLFRIEVHGEQHLPQQGKVLVIANHQSYLDGLLIGLFLPFRATFVIHTTVLDNWLFRQIFRYVPYLAVDQTSALGIKKILKLVDSGEAVVIFPEGRISTTGSLMKVYEGPGFIAAKTGAQIVPVRVEGAAYSIYGRLDRAFPRPVFPKISLYIQAQEQIAMPEAANSKLRRKLAGDAMQQLMQRMLAAGHSEHTLFSALLQTIRLHGRRRQVMEDIRQTRDSYGSLLKKSLALARLVSKISQPGDTLGVLMPNLNSTVGLIYGMSAVQRVPAMLNYTAGAQGMHSACVTAGIRVILTSRQFLEAAKLTEMVAAIPDVKLVYLEDLRARFTLLDKLWLLGYALWRPQQVSIPTSADAPAVVLFTSGSEGKPKGVVLSHRNILSNVTQIRAVIEFSPHDKFFMALPLFHAFGFTAGAILPVLSGAGLMLYPSPLHYRVIPEVIYDRNCTVLFGTSTFLAHYGKFAHPYDFNRLRYVVAGAEKLADSVKQQWIDKFGIRILEGYGATECSPVLAVNTPMAQRAGSVGRLMPGMQYQLLPVPGITRGGLLHVHGPNVMLGYYFHDHPARLHPTAAILDGHTERAGWYNTGDIVEVDTEGYVHILGRVKRFAKIAGEMVSLEVVEQIAVHASPEHQHAASTQPDAQRGETILLFTTDAQLTREALQAGARQLGSPEIAVARRIIVVKELPLLGTGKIDYVALKLLAESQH